MKISLKLDISNGYLALPLLYFDADLTLGTSLVAVHAEELKCQPCYQQNRYQQSRVLTVELNDEVRVIGGVLFDVQVNAIKNCSAKGAVRSRASKVDIPDLVGSPATSVVTPVCNKKQNKTILSLIMFYRMQLRTCTHYRRRHDMALKGNSCEEMSSKSL